MDDIGRTGTSVSQRKDVIVAFWIGVGFLIVLLGLAVVIPNPSESQVLVFRTVLALGGAAFSTALTGVLSMKLGFSQRLTIMSAGSFAVFVLLYLYSPGISRHTSVVQVHPAMPATTSVAPTPPAHSGVHVDVRGDKNPTVIGNSGTVDIKIDSPSRK